MKRIGFKILYIFTAIVIIVELGFAIKGSLFSDISELPVGTLKRTISSPSGEKVMNIYLVKNNLGTAVRGEISENGKNHNIFWQTDIEDVQAVWLDNERLSINEIVLESDDTFGYDSRRGYSIFDEGSLEQNFTNFRGENEKE